jgi:hypothetical protein
MEMRIGWLRLEDQSSLTTHSNDYRKLGTPHDNPIARFLDGVNAGP